MDASRDLELLVRELERKVESLEERARHTEPTLSRLRSDLIMVALVAGGARP